MKVRRGMELLRHPRYDRTATSMRRSSPIGLRDAVLSQISHDPFSKGRAEAVRGDAWAQLAQPHQHGPIGQRLVAPDAIKPRASIVGRDYRATTVITNPCVAGSPGKATSRHARAWGYVRRKPVTGMSFVRLVQGIFYRKEMVLSDPKASGQTPRTRSWGHELPFALRRCSASGASAIHNVAI